MFNCRTRRLTSILCLRLGSGRREPSPVGWLAVPAGHGSRAGCDVGCSCIRSSGSFATSPSFDRLMPSSHIYGFPTFHRAELVPLSGVLKGSHQPPTTPTLTQAE